MVKSNKELVNPKIIHPEKSHRYVAKLKKSKTVAFILIISEIFEHPENFESTSPA